MHRDLNDIIPPSRRRKEGMDAMPQPAQQQSSAPEQSMRDMAPSPRQEAAAPTEPQAFEPTPISRPLPVEPRQPIRSPRIGSRFPYGTAIIAVLVIIACGGVLYAFSGAKVTIMPTSEPASIQSDLTATAGQGSLPFQVVTVSKTATVNVPAESTETANDPAQGTITITNKETAAQPLITNTRFATPSGLVYRIHAPVSIPAGGSVTATIYADQPGASYNLASTTIFTVPGLQGSSAFNLVTAQSNGPIAGGFSGTRPSVSQATKDTQYATLQSQLAADLQKDLQAKMPAGYVLVPGASVTNYVPQTDAAGPSNTVTLGQQGTTIAIVFPSVALAQTIAYSVVGTYGGQPVTVNDVSGLTVKPADPTQITASATSFGFNLSGSTQIVYQIDPTTIAGTVAGKNRTAAEQALQSLPEVAQATLVLRPFWASTFPGDPSKIKVVVATPATGK